MKKLLLAASAAFVLAGAARADNIPWANAPHYQCAALCTSLAVNPTRGPHSLFSFEVNADSTLAGATWYILVYDSATVPGDGAVTPAKCYQLASGTTQAGGTFASQGVGFSKGIVVVTSTTGCFTQTSSTHAYIAIDFQ